MSKKKSSTNIAVSKKTDKPAKTAKSTKPVTVNYLAPLHEVTKCIENDYSQLKKLLEATPAKLEKAITDVKTKLKKSKETQTKSEKLLAEAKKKQKVKPDAKNKQALVKSEKLLTEAKAAMTAFDVELKQLTEQLQTCKKMSNEYGVIEKSVKKIRADFEKRATSKPKKVAAKSKSKVKSSEKIQTRKSSTLTTKTPKTTRATKLTAPAIKVAVPSLTE